MIYATIGSVSSGTMRNEDRQAAMTDAIMRRARRLSSARGRQIWVLLFPTGRVVLRDAYVRGTVLIAIAIGDDVIYN